MHPITQAATAVATSHSRLGSSPPLRPSLTTPLGFSAPSALMPTDPPDGQNTIYAWPRGLPQTPAEHLLLPADKSFTV